MRNGDISIQYQDIENTHITSDQHFGHENIIRYAQRPYRTVEQMDQDLINKWNEVVKPGDTVIHLGDFCFGNKPTAEKYLRRLNGKVYVLQNPWHHDKSWMDPPTETECVFMPPIVVMEIPFPGRQYKQAITLCHYRMEIWDRKHYGSWHLHGHSHQNFPNEPWKPGDYRLNVCVEQTQYTPISLRWVVNIMEDKLGWK